MKNMGDIRNRIKSIKQTSQITSAMYLLSTSRVRKALNRVERYRYYVKLLRESMREVIKKADEISHKYIVKRERARAAYIVIAGDKGMCGGYNNNVLEFALKKIKEKNADYILTIGHVARDFFESRGYQVDIEFLHLEQNPTMFSTRELVTDILDMYDNDLMDEVYVVFTSYESSVKQEPIQMKLLPIELYEYEDDYVVDIGELQKLYEPDEKVVLDNLVPQFIISLMFGAILQAYISEHTARLTAMESAKKNANEMIDKLTLLYNQARQYAITQEISEIVAAAESLGTGRQ